MVCKKSHRFWKRFKGLPPDQGGSGRHRCAGCAFEAGHDMGIAGRAEPDPMEIDSIIEALQESQAGTVRHKSPHAAFSLGFTDGISTRRVSPSRG